MGVLVMTFEVRHKEQNMEDKIKATCFRINIFCYNKRKEKRGNVLLAKDII